jgi:hypothetical protein
MNPVLFQCLKRPANSFNLYSEMQKEHKEILKNTKLYIFIFRTRHIEDSDL